MNSNRADHPAPTHDQVRRMTRKTDRDLRAVGGPRSAASRRKKALAHTISGLRLAFPPAGYDPESAEALFRETI